MEFKGIIPELKMSEAGRYTAHYYLARMRQYPVLSINTSGLFDGELDYLKQARKMHPDKFLIRKDFIMLPKQIKESKEAGANAVLILRNYLTDKQYDILIKACELFEVIPLTEVQGKMKPSCNCLVMINSRNLNIDEINKKEAEELCKYYKKEGFNVIYASGENSDRVVKKGIADAVLIGTAFMKDKLKHHKV